MASFLFGLMILLLLNCSKALQNFETVSECPSNASSWKMKSDKKDCKGDTPNYLCAAIENHVGKYGEICTRYGLTPINKCAVLNAQTHNLDSVDCKAASGCPQDPYIPSELWKCIANIKEMSRPYSPNMYHERHQ